MNVLLGVFDIIGLSSQIATFHSHYNFSLLFIPFAMVGLHSSLILIVVASLGKLMANDTNALVIAMTGREMTVAAS